MHLTLPVYHVYVLTALSLVADGRRVDFTTKGAIEVDTNENSVFLWHGEVYVLENIPCYYTEHASRWDERFANASYSRIRREDDGSIVTNISATIGYGFVSAFVDEDFDTVWFFGSACNRCISNKDQGCVSERRVTAWVSSDVKLQRWSAPVDLGGTVATYNVEVARVRASAAHQAANGLPPHSYVMILEEEQRYLVNAALDGNLRDGWSAIPGSKVPKVNGGPSIRYSELDGYYYALLGGHTVDLFRTKDFKTWESSPNAPFLAPSAADAQISNLFGFTPQRAAARGFTPMAGAANVTRWDLNSNDADVCCMTKDARFANTSLVVWGAGTQGRPPKAPLTKANHCANVIAQAPMSLPQLLAAHFA